MQSSMLKVTKDRYASDRMSVSARALASLLAHWILIATDVPLSVRSMRSSTLDNEQIPVGPEAIPSSLALAIVVVTALVTHSTCLGENMDMLVDGGRLSTSMTSSIIFRFLIPA
jgi:hypothetical protein